MTAIQESLFSDGAGPGVVRGIGYEGRSLAEFVADLVAAGVEVVVDVRLTPISRKPGFSRRALAAALAEVGIDYRHTPALGNPKPNRAGFTGTPDEWSAARRRYAQMLDASPAQRALQEIVELARPGTVAVLCFEADQRHCHRDVVLHRLQTSGISVSPVPARMDPAVPAAGKDPQS